MTDRSPGPSRAGATLLLVATFALGMIAGGALLHIARLSLAGPPRPGPPPPGERREGPLQHLARELDLDPDQFDRVRDILEESRDRLHAEAEATRERIREVLTPEQRERYETMHRPPFAPGGAPPGPRRPQDRPPRPPRRP